MIFTIQIKSRLILFLCIFSVQLAVSQSASEKCMLLFHTGFEGTTRVVEDNATKKGILGYFKGQDNTVSSPNNWDSITNGNAISRFFILYEGGDSTMRYARVIPEPGNPKNHVLKYWVNQANAFDFKKARVQTQFITNPTEGIHEFYQSVRIFLPKDMEILKDYPEGIGNTKTYSYPDWLSIFELWNKPPSFPKSHCRITLSLDKEPGSNHDLYFKLETQDRDIDSIKKKDVFVNTWKCINKEVPVPFGRWITLEIYFKEGNAENGRMYVTYTSGKGKKQVLFDVKNITYYTKETHPKGFDDCAVMKFYSSKRMADYMREKGKALEIYWDDLSFWKNLKPQGMKLK